MNSEKVVSNNEPRNNSIDIFRMFCAITIVMLHTKFLFDVSNTLGYISKHVVSRIAVPFFFCIMGYYYIKKLLNNEKPFKSTFKKLMIIYLTWSVIYYLFNLFNPSYVDSSLLTYTFKCIRDFFYNGTNGLHLWFFPGSFFCLIIVTLAHKKNLLKPLAILSIILYIIVTIGSAYPNIAKNIPIFSNIVGWKYYDIIIRHYFGNALAFFCMGYLFNYLETKNKIKKNNKKDIIIEILLVILFFVENFVIFKFIPDHYQSICFSLYPLVFQTVKLLINNPMPKLKNVSIKTKHIADFMYYSHILFRDLYSMILINCFHLSSKSIYTLVFTLTIITTILIALLLSKFSKNKFIRKNII